MSDPSPTPPSPVPPSPVPPPTPPLVDPPEGEQRSGAPRAPFDPSKTGGCGKPLLVMGIAFAVLVITALVVFAFKAGSLLALTFRSVAPTIVERLDEEVTEAQRQRLLEAFEAAALKAESGDLDPTRLVAVQRSFQELAAASSVSAVEAEELSSALEELAGTEPVEPAGPAEPSPAAPDPPLSTELSLPETRPIE